MTAPRPSGTEDADRPADPARPTAAPADRAAPLSRAPLLNEGPTLNLPGKVLRMGRRVLGVGAARGRPGALTVGLDALPLFGPRTGIGRYVAEVCGAVATQPDPPDQVLVVPGLQRPLPQPLPPHVRGQARGFPGGFLARGMARGFPPVEALTGRLDVYHGGNYEMHPVRRAATAVTVHDLTFLRFPHTVQPVTMRMLADLPTRVLGYDAVFAVTQAMADEIAADLQVPAERIVVVPHGVDPVWSRAVPLSRGRREQLGVPERHLLFVGTMEPRKNLPTLLAAHQAARAQDPDVPDLVLVGGLGWGDLPAHLRDGAPGLVLTGYLDDADVQGLVAGALAVCSPSVYEGFGLPVVEALAAGTRVLASDIGAHREVSHGRAELLPATDVDAWAQALTDVAREPDTGRDARRAAVAGYTWQESGRRHLQTYRELAGRT